MIDPTKHTAFGRGSKRQEFHWEILVSENMFCKWVYSNKQQWWRICAWQTLESWMTKRKMIGEAWFRNRMQILSHCFMFQNFSASSQLKNCWLFIADAIRRPWPFLELFGPLAIPAFIALLWSKKNVHISFIVYTAYAYSIYIFLYIGSSIVKK